MGSQIVLYATQISEPPNPNEIDAVVLCGGLGTRLKKVVSDRPKPMADINGRPFLELLLGSIAKFGFRRFVLCAGYMADSITDFFASKRLPFEVVVSRESRPLGTAAPCEMPHASSGAIRSSWQRRFALRG